MKTLPALLLSALLLPGLLRAANQTDTFEFIPNATPVWQTSPPAAPLLSGHGGYIFENGNLEVSTAASISGDQSLKFSGTAAGAELRLTGGTTGGGGYQVF